jgi:hypothetical protein
MTSSGTSGYPLLSDVFNAVERSNEMEAFQDVYVGSDLSEVGINLPWCMIFNSLAQVSLVYL